MSDPAPTPPPTEPAVAPPVEPAAVAPTPPTEPAVEARHPAHKTLFDRLMSDVEEEPENSPPAEPPPAEPAAVVPPVEPPVAEPTEPGIKVRRAKRPDLPVAQEPAIAPVAPAAAPVETDGQFESGLLDTERQMIADAAYAEGMDPEKHKGLADKTRNYFRSHKKFLDEHPDIQEDDPIYEKFMADNRPTLSTSERRNVEVTRAAEEARAPIEKRMADLEHQSFVRSETPKIESRSQEVFNELSRTSLPDEVSDLVKEKGVDEAQKTYGEEFRIASSIFTAVTEDLKEFSRLNTKSPTTGRALSSFASDPSDPKYEQHSRLLRMVDDFSEDFKNNPKSQLQRNGKWFVTRSEYFELPPERRKDYWSFSNDEIVKVALSGVKSVVADSIKTHREDMERRGYTRTPVEPAQAPVVAPVPAGTPAPRPSPVPAIPATPPPAIDAATKNLAGILTGSE